MLLRGEIPALNVPQGLPLALRSALAVGNLWISRSHVRWAEMVKRVATRGSLGGTMFPVETLIHAASVNGDDPHSSGVHGPSPYDLALAFQSLHLYEDARLVVECIPADRRANKHWQLLADLANLTNRPEDALAALERQSLDRLSANGRANRVAALATALSLAGDYPAALGELSAFHAAGPAHKPSLLLSRMLQQVHEVDAAWKVLTELGLRETTSISDAQRLADFLIDTNRLAEAEAVVRRSMTLFRRSTGLLARLARIHWMSGDLAAIDAVAAHPAAAAPSLDFARVMMSFGGAVPSLEPVRMARVARLAGEAQNRAPARADQVASLLAGAQEALTLEDFETAHVLADRVVRGFAFVPDAWKVRGLAALGLERWEEAANALDTALRLNPQSIECYGARFDLLFQEDGSEERCRALIAARDRHVPRHRQRLPDGRKILYDQARYKLSLRRGDYVDGVSARHDQSAVGLVEHLFPGRYLGRRRWGFPDGRRSSAAVIGQDGVGDETRWAQYYPRLADHYDRVVISCEPRLASLFGRSFPGFEFMPVPRRWPAVPSRLDDLRREIRDLSAAAKMTPELLSAAGACDDVYFIEDVALACWQTDGVRGESPSGAGTGRYLQPDESRAAPWLARFAGRTTIGLIWKSGLRSAQRNRHYVALEDLLPLVRPGVRYVGLQHAYDEEERALCARFGIETLDGVDLYDDFEEIAAVTSALDCVIGISTLTWELAAAVGTPVWLLAISPEGRYQRLGDSPGDRDRQTWNGRVFHGAGERGFRDDRAVIVARSVARAGAALDEALATGTFLPGVPARRTLEIG
jgi:tetratricopeptide (TPR) repeat protein